MIFVQRHKAISLWSSNSLDKGIDVDIRPLLGGRVGGATENIRGSGSGIRVRTKFVVK
jgi:hypothetical protein